AGQLQRDPATRIGDGEILRRQGGELRTRRRRDHLLLAKLGERAVDLVEQLEACQRAALAQPTGAVDSAGCGGPGRPLRFLETAPGRGDAAEDAANARLRHGPRVAWDDEGTANLPVPAPLRDV